jgi:hypothetical protein
MSLERPFIGITAAEASEQATWFATDNNYQRHQRELLREVYDAHRPLAMLWRSNAKRQGPQYLESAVLSYDLSIDRLNLMGIQIDFGPGEMQAHQKGRNAVNNSLSKELLHPSEWEPLLLDKDIKSPFADFLSNLFETSPDYYDFVKQKVEDTPSLAVRGDILFGVYDGLMPFYGKLESANLGKQWDITAPIDQSHPEWVAPVLTPEDLKRIYSIDSVFPQQEGIDEN